jgi:glycosyltransferase involved in cell wall biosynthesis
MTQLPVSIVTCSSIRRFIGRTIESVLTQEYPNLEHIVVDGMSCDETQEILSRYPHLRVIREPDSGQADAINKGFRCATGDIFCFLNSDDTFEPGALHRVAREIDPAAGRHIGWVAAGSSTRTIVLSVEHPSGFESHRRVLQIWKGHAIPQPATFWTREVWNRCGPLNEHEQLVLDYDLFCRFSREYAFHTFDQVVANYLLHAESKTQGVTDAQRLLDAVRVSQRYWGPLDTKARIDAARGLVLIRSLEGVPLTSRGESIGVRVVGDRGSRCAAPCRPDIALALSSRTARPACRWPCAAVATRQWRIGDAARCRRRPGKVSRVSTTTVGLVPMSN